MKDLFALGYRADAMRWAQQRVLSLFSRSWTWLPPWNADRFGGIRNFNGDGLYVLSGLLMIDTN